VAAFVGEPIDLRSVLPDGRRGRVHGTHSLWGNPNRFESGPIELRIDDEWTGKLGGAPRAAATVLNGPYLVKYGYPLRVTHRSAPGGG
jgi:hypothetical protein